VPSEGQSGLLQERPTRLQRTPREWRVVGRRRRAPVPCPRGRWRRREGRIVGRLPFRGSNAVLLLGQAHGELLRLDVGGQSSGGGSGVGGAGGGGRSWRRGPTHRCCAGEGPVAGAVVLFSRADAQRRCSAGPTRVALLGREERGRRAWRCSTGRKREESRLSSIS
jgi:hypothetical protein